MYPFRINYLLMNVVKFKDHILKRDFRRSKLSLVAPYWLAGTALAIL